jgi:hypothetical protein
MPSSSSRLPKYVPVKGAAPRVIWIIAAVIATSVFAASGWVGYQIGYRMAPPPVVLQPPPETK